ncbi:MAG: ATP-binding protein [Spirochaetes bacterium]|nr:ATP-binding protein [Spirochaetota bacterium]
MRENSVFGMGVILRRYLTAVCVLAAMAVAAPGSLFAFMYDLSKSDMFMKTGFSQEWISSLPQGDGWLKAAKGPTGVFPLRIAKLGLREMPAHRFLSLTRQEEKHFTFVTSFEIPDASLIREKHLGLFLAQIGINWEAYLNGTLIQSEMRLRPDGSIATGRNTRLKLLYLNPYLLKPGTNVLGFRIVGDPTLIDTGFYRNAPYLVGEYDALVPLTRETGTLILLFIYLSFGLYHIFLFLNRRDDRYNLYYGLFSVALFIYNIVRTSEIYALVPDTNLLTRAEMLSLYTLLPLMGAFLEMILFKRYSVFLKIYSGFSLLLIAGTLATPAPSNVDILRIWQITAVIPLLYYLVCAVGRSYYGNVRDLHAPGGVKAGRIFGALGRALWSTVAGNLLIGCVVMVACTVIDIIDAMFYSSTVAVAKYGFFFFIIGIALILANRFIYIHGKVASLNTDLESNIRDLREANRMIGLSEEKYKHLVEGSNDIIFSLDENLNFVTVNRAVNALLRYNPDAVLKMNLMDLIYESPTLTSFTKQIVREKLDQFLKNREPLVFKVQMQTAYSSEPKDMQVRLENLKVDGKNEIVGKATSIVEDSLLHSFVSENQKYVIGNFITIAEEMSYRMTRNLSAFIDSRDAGLLRIALFEILINAIEHGNLAISFDEKTEAVQKGNYIEFLSKRQNDPNFAGKGVKIEYSVNAERVVYIVTDEGSGFDHYKAVEDDSSNANAQFLAHGRGITMTKNIFDRVKYNERGNQVMLIKYFRQDAAGG